MGPLFHCVASIRQGITRRRSKQIGGAENSKERATLHRGGRGRDQALVVCAQQGSEWPEVRCQTSRLVFTPRAARQTYGHHLVDHHPFHINAPLTPFCILSYLFPDICMVFEVLGESSLRWIQRYHYRGLPFPLVQTMARHALTGLAFLHDECGIIHTDLKPENLILLRHNPCALPPARVVSNRASLVCASCISHSFHSLLSALAFVPPVDLAQVRREREAELVRLRLLRLSVSGKSSSSSSAAPLSKAQKKRLKQKQKKLLSKYTLCHNKSRHH